MAEDYIMRLIQQVAAMLAAIVAKRREGKPQEAQQQVDATCFQTIGLPLSTVKRLTPDALAQHLAQSGGNRCARSVLLAELLIQNAELLEAEREHQMALGAYIHAFCLLFDSMPELSNEEQAIYRPKLDALAGRLEHLPPNPYMTHKLDAHRKAAANLGSTNAGPAPS